MAGPVAAKVNLPDDSGNTGPKVRTQTRVVGGNTVHEHFFISQRQAEILAVYRAVLDQQTVQAAAQNGTSSGFLWAHVPVAVANKKARLRKIMVDTQHSSALATPTAPRLVAQRFTFTGTASGATVAASKTNSGDPAAVLDLRTAVTGLTVSLVNKFKAFGIVGALTAVGAYAPAPIVLGLHDAEDEWHTFASGEGFVLWQDVAGTAADTRKLNISLLWDEIDTA